ncbi:MAG TPA: hypothetical protein VFC78_10665 [Tepidisphaeraceae bacterium]|nr:hypothetical protein [Tepidisphaeraceae bacterium]
MRKKTSNQSSPGKAPARKKDPNKYPKGWNRKRVEAVIAHYENQTDEQAIAEARAAYHDPATTMMAVPIQLVQKVQRLIARERAS